MKKKCTFITLVFALTLIGCKPVQTVQERYITTIDSTAVMTLKEMLRAEVQRNEALKTQLECTKSENTKLTNEIENHEIHYDTTAPVDVRTGKYPIASETITTSRSVLEKELKEQEKLLREQSIEIKAQAQHNKNLVYEVESLRNENSELKSKISKCGFSLKWLIYGVAAGIIVTIIGLALWKMK